MLSGIAHCQKPLKIANTTEPEQTKVLNTQRTVEEREALKRVMKDLSLNMESEVYRACRPKYLDFKTMTLQGNPKSTATVIDHYNLHPNPQYEFIKSKMENGKLSKEEFDGLQNFPLFKQFTNREMHAFELPHPSLNVSGIKSCRYLKNERILISIKISDVINNEGLIYKDVGCPVDCNPLIVTIPPGKDIPFRIEEVADGDLLIKKRKGHPLF